MATNAALSKAELTLEQGEKTLLQTLPYPTLHPLHSHYRHPRSRRCADATDRHSTVVVKTVVKPVVVKTVVVKTVVVKTVVVKTASVTRQQESACSALGESVLPESKS